jgi:hemolysin D
MRLDKRNPEQKPEAAKALAIRRNADELAFLPAALEIVETPASPTGRVVGALIIAIFCLALVWAAVGKIDIVATAQGKIVSSGRTKVIQPFETGVIRAIHVHDGQQVKAGEPLIELDPTITQAERDHLRSDLMSARLDIARLNAALAEGDAPVDAFHPPEGASPDLVAVEKRYLLDQVAEHRAKIGALAEQVRQKEAEHRTILAMINKLQATIPVLQEKTDIRKQLLDKQNGSKITYLEDLSALLDQQKELEVQKSKLQEADAAVAAVTQTRAQTDSEYRRGLSNDLVEAERKAAGLARDVDKANERTRLQVLSAPVDGVVQQLAVHTVGGVVTPAQTLLAVVPNDSPLEIEAMVSNRDIGFVQPGQEVEIKVDTFTFTRYGLLHGDVLSVSHDSIAREKQQDKSGNNPSGSADQRSSEPPGQELSYAARISLDRTQMRIEDNVVNLMPGMAVTTEIKTGSRRVITYLLSPLLRYGHDSLRER